HALSQTTLPHHNMSSTAADDPTQSINVPIDTLRQVARSFDETLASDNDAAQWRTTAPNTIMVCNVLDCLRQSGAQKKESARSFKHSIRYVANADTFYVDLFNVDLCWHSMLAALHRLSNGRLL